MQHYAKISKIKYKKYCYFEHFESVSGDGLDLQKLILQSVFGAIFWEGGEEIKKLHIIPKIF